MIRAFVAALALSGCAAAQTETEILNRSADADAPGAQGEAMIAAADPRAVEAGLEILRQGGTAADAAVAVQAVLGLVEPQSSGLGGGGFLVYYGAETEDVTVYDGRERAPAAATQELFYKDDGAPLSFREAWTSGRAAGVPGAVDALRLAQADHGRLEWESLFADPIRLAGEGFKVSPRLNMLLTSLAEVGPLDERPATRNYFYNAEGEAWPVDHVLKNPDYAYTLRAIADNPRALLESGIAGDIVTSARNAPYGSALTEADLADYEAQQRAPICRPYREWLVCSARPPSSGGVAINSALEILEHFPIRDYGPETVEGWHYFIEAQRLAYADRDRYVADNEFVDVPVDALLAEDYLARRAQMVQPDAAIPSIEAGEPFAGADDIGIDSSQPRPSTSHFVIVDGYGNVVSMTTTVESAFGSHIMTNGFLLNNQLTDFALEAYDSEGRPLANAPGPRKRPRSSMSPTIVLDADTRDFVMATGSPGGNSIIAYTLKSLVGVLDWGLDPQDTAELPNVVARGDVVQIDTNFDPEIAEQLRAMGHNVAEPEGEISGIHTVMATETGLVGAADPRREGVARPLD